MNEEELRHEMLPCLEKLIRFSLLNDLNVHSPLGGKYGELLVVSNLWAHRPKIASQRDAVKGVKRPRGCDIVLESTRKRIEVKWAMLHHRPTDWVMKMVDGIPFWGWGFSGGSQFKESKFDYCILLAAHKDNAHPGHIFILKLNEMTEELMGGSRRSAVSSRRSFFIEFSENRDFYYKRKWHPRGPSPLEESLFTNGIRHRARWKELKLKGSITE